MEHLQKSHVMQHLNTLNEQERFYQKYHQNKQANTLQGFLKNYDKDYLLAKGIYIEELLSNGSKAFESEDVAWSTHTKDIEIQKYNRFMPQLVAIHDFFEIIYVIENKMEMEIEGEKSVLFAGDLLFLPPQTIHKPMIYDDTIALQMRIRKSTFQHVFYTLLKGNNVLSEFFLYALYLKGSKSVVIYHGGHDENIFDCFLHLYVENYNQLPNYEMVLNHLF